MNTYSLFTAVLPPLRLFLENHGGTVNTAPVKTAFDVLIVILAVLAVVFGRSKKIGSIPAPKRGPSAASRAESPREKEKPGSVPVISEGTKQRREELKSLLEAGLISRDEYQERLKKLGKD